MCQHPDPSPLLLTHPERNDLTQLKDCSTKVVLVDHRVLMFVAPVELQKGIPGHTADTAHEDLGDLVRDEKSLSSRLDTCLLVSITWGAWYVM